MIGLAKTLIVVYKDEMLMNQLKKLVETNDDLENGEIVGTTDGSINIVAWNERTWLDNKAAGNINDKVLFLGDIKGSEKFVPVIDVKFDDFGVKFGWAGKQAVLCVAQDALIEKSVYEGFLGQLSSMPVPEMVKKSQMFDCKEEDSLSEKSYESEKDVIIDGIGKISADAIKKAKKGIVKGAKIVEKLGRAVADNSEESTAKKFGSTIANKASDISRSMPANVFCDIDAVKRQQLFYGVVKLYNENLEEFMNL